MWILDASVAVKWFFPDEQWGEKALQVLEKLVENPDDFAVPELFFTECFAALTVKSHHDQEFVANCMAQVFDLGMHGLAFGKTSAMEALEIACKFKVSFYDSIYVATAQSLNGKWLTADQRALQNLKRWGQSLKEF